MPLGSSSTCGAIAQVRYRGLAKNAAQIFTLLALANFYLARHELRST